MKNISYLLILFSLPLFSQKIETHRLYTDNGRKTSFKKMVKTIEKEADIVLFGEFHNNSIAHWMQLELIMELHQLESLILGAEMLEADNQEVLADYLTGKIDKKGLDTLARLWNNFDTDYYPLLEFAKVKSLPFVATNIPRRYASMVYKGGFEALDTLSEQEKSWIAPLPIDYDPELPGYKKMVEMMPGHGGENLPKAQAIKDATMAHFILENMKESSVLIHFNGAFHSDNYDGIYWYLKKRKPTMNIITISMVTQEDVTSLDKENEGKAHFILCVDEDVPGSY